VPVVVVVRGCRAHCIPDPRTRAVGHVREAELTVIAIEAIRVAAALFSSDGVSAPFVKKMSGRPSPL
jgi:hypothetical protein